MSVFKGWRVGLALIATLSGAACSSATEPSLGERLVGSWAWLDATEPVSGEVVTPDDVGYSVTLRFLASGTAELLRSGEVVASTTYFVGVTDDGGTDVIEYQAPLHGFAIQTVALGGDELVLMDQCCDGHVYRYTRIP